MRSHQLPGHQVTRITKSKRRMRTANSILVIDAGNTTVTTAVFRGKTLVGTRNIFTKGALSGRKISLGNPSWRNLGVRQAYASSVVPEIRSWLVARVREEFGCPVKFLNYKIVERLGIKVRYQPKSAVGCDRLALSLAIAKDKGPSIGIDFGTGLTFDVLDEKRNYLGGLIFPGAAVAYASLEEKASLLRHKRSLRNVRHLIGDSTGESLGAGRFWGYLSLVEGVVARIEKFFGKTCRVYFTGKDSFDIFKKFRHAKKTHDPHLVLRGLRVFSGYFE